MSVQPLPILPSVPNPAPVRRASDVDSGGQAEPFALPDETPAPKAAAAKDADEADVSPEPEAKTESGAPERKPTQRPPAARVKASTEKQASAQETEALEEANAEKVTAKQDVGALVSIAVAEASTDGETMKGKDSKEKIKDETPVADAVALLAEVPVSEKPVAVPVLPQPGNAAAPVKAADEKADGDGKAVEGATNAPRRAADAAGLLLRASAEPSAISVEAEAETVALPLPTASDPQATGKTVSAALVAAAGSETGIKKQMATISQVAGASGEGAAVDGAGEAAATSVGAATHTAQPGTKVTKEEVDASANTPAAATSPQADIKPLDILAVPQGAPIDLSTATPQPAVKAAGSIDLSVPTQPTAAQTQTLPNETATGGLPTPIHMVPIEIGMKAMSGARSFDIRLDPGELGRVDVKLDISDSGEVSAKLVVDRVETLHMLQRDARTLERAFEQAGLKPSDAGVDITLRDPSDQSGARQNRQQDDAPRRVNLAVDAGEDGSVAVTQSVSAPARRFVRLGGVDLSI